MCKCKKKLKLILLFHNFQNIPKYAIEVKYSQICKSKYFFYELKIERIVHIFIVSQDCIDSVIYDM